MEITAKRHWWKVLVGVLLTPILLFLLLMTALYVPPIQQLVKEEVASVISESTGFQVTMGRLDLRFPLNLLVRDVKVDTLLEVGSLDVSVHLRPLFKGQVVVDGIKLESVQLNTAQLIDGVNVQGGFGQLALRSYIDMNTHTVQVREAMLSNADVRVKIVEPTLPEDTTSAPFDWLIGAEQVSLQQVSVHLDIPADTLSLKTTIQEALAKEVQVDLLHSYYGTNHLKLDDSFLQYVAGNDTAAVGLDVSHLTFFHLNAEIDSAYYQGRDMQALVRQLSFDERSGLSVTSLQTHFSSDSALIRLPDLALTTTHSEVRFSGELPWSVLEHPSEGLLSANLQGRIGREDLFLLAGVLPSDFRQRYPAHPLSVRGKLTGNFQQLQLSNLTAQLPGAFSLDGEGTFFHLTDSIKRHGNIKVNAFTRDMGFLPSLLGSRPDSTLLIPDSIRLQAQLELQGNALSAQLNAMERQGKLSLDASYDLNTEDYRANLIVDSLDISHFLPYDSIYELSAQVQATGRGTDILGPKATARFEGVLNQLHYKNWQLDNVSLQGALQRQLVDVEFTSDNALVEAQGKGQLLLGSNLIEGKMDLDIAQIDLYKWGIVSQPLHKDMAFTLKVEAGRDSLIGRLEGGDMFVMFRSRMGVDGILQQGREFDKLLQEQFANRQLDFSLLSAALPQGGLMVRAGNENPVNYYLSTLGMGFHDMQVGYGFSPVSGINGRAEVHGLRIDSIRLDTAYLAIRQDTSRIAFHGAVVNGPKHPQITFRSHIDGEIRSEDADINLTFEDKNGTTGLLFGLNAKPVADDYSETTSGYMFHFIPENPIIGFQEFKFVDDHDWLYLRSNDLHVSTRLELKSDNDLGIMVKSNDEDTLSLQNLNLEITRLQLSDFSKLLPYLPTFAGLTSLDASYVQTATSMQVSAEGLIDEFSYEGHRVGDLGLGATWLPGDAQTHYIDTYLTCDDQEALTANGSFKTQGGQTLIDVLATMEQLPLRMANAFIPDQIIAFQGDMQGEIQVSGTVEKPGLNGELTFNEVSLFARQAGATYRFDSHPVSIDANKILFNKFAVYTTADNPLTIDGHIDMSAPSNPVANLRVEADNYTLLDAVKTKESLVYGKVYVDINATLRGPLLEGPVMRGNMNVLGSTNATYVMIDSPLSVEDRLDGLVTFVSFSEEEENKEEAPSMSLGGVDMLMTVHLDDAVRLKADLSADRSRYVELTGGGDLSMRLTPQGDMNFTGRYTITGGTMKYSLPVIPLKEFTIVNGSYVEWRGNIMNPQLSITAIEHTRASVSNGSDEGSRRVDFDVTVSIQNSLESPDLSFDLSATNDAEVQNELLSLSADERGKQAITMLATGIYIGGGSVVGERLTMGTALNSVLQNQINALAGSTMQNANFSMGIDNRTDGSGSTLTDYSFRYSQRFFNDRVQINIGGKVTAGKNATNNSSSFIDNVSLEYRVDKSGTRYLRAFHNKNYEDLLDGEITETGVGILFRKKLDRLSELWIFNKK